MARRSAADKADTHDQILRHASQAFRAHGSGVGIGEVMKDLGLTHGGFYRHFESKDALLVEAIALGLDEVAERLAHIADQAEPGKELEAIITAYLSTEHLKHPETWCVLASLAPEIGRQSVTVRKRLDASLSGYMEKLARYMPGATPHERSRNFVVIMSGMAGAIAMARAMGNKDMREFVLEQTREYYLATFANRHHAHESA